MEADVGGMSYIHSLMLVLVPTGGLIQGWRQNHKSLCFCTQKVLHREAFTRRCLYTGQPLHTDAFTHRSIYKYILLRSERMEKEWDLQVAILS